MARAPVWLVTGVPAAGKTTVCAALAERYPRALRVRVDLLGEAGLWLHGRASRARDPERHAQDRLLERRAVAGLATEYAEAAVPVVIDDTLETDAERCTYSDTIAELRLVFLLPSLEAALRRNATRTNKPPGDAPMLEAIARRLYQQMAAAHTPERGWFVLDSTALDVRETVDAIVARYGL